MRIKIWSIVAGTINGGILSIMPLFVYDYILSNNLGKPRATDVALRGSLGSIFLVLIVNIIILSIIYKLEATEAPKKHVFLWVVIAWIGAAIVLIFLEKGFDISGGSTNDEDIVAAFALLCSILNFATIIIATIIAKVTIKLKTKISGD